MQGGVRFFSLNTGEIINRHKNDYTILPIPKEVINRVNRMAQKSRAGLHFADRHNNANLDDSGTDDDDSTDNDYVPTDTRNNMILNTKVLIRPLTTRQMILTTATSIMMTMLLSQECPSIRTLIRTSQE